MEDPAEERLAKARKICELWFLLEAGARRSGALGDESRKASLVEKLLSLCLPEVCQALYGDPVGQVFCGLRLVVDTELRPIRIIGNLSILRDSMRSAFRSYSEQRPEHISEHVKISISNTLADERDKHIARLRKLPPEDVAATVLEMVKCDARYAATVILDHLTFRQLCLVLELLRIHLRGKVAGVWLGSEHEPKDGLLWLVWYAGRLCAVEPNVQQILTEDAKADHAFLLIREGPGAQLTSKDGSPLDLAGPMWVKQVEKLARTSGTPEQGTISAIARSQSVDRYVVRRWKKEGTDLPEPYLDGDQVGISFTVDDVLRSYEIAKGKKRGRKPKRT